MRKRRADAGGLKLWFLTAIAAYCWIARPGAAGPMQFTNVTESAGIDYVYTFPRLGESGKFNEHSWLGGGACAEDFDGDGWIDLFVLQGGAELPPLLYMNQHDGTFAEESAARGANIDLYAGNSAAAADFDNDGDIDICAVHRAPPHFLLINDGTGHFTADRIMLTQPIHLVTSPSWGDVDNDGFLELALGEWWLPTLNDPPALWIYKNKGGHRLEPYEFRSDATPTEKFVFSPRFADINGDRLADFLVVCDFTQSQLFLNEGNGLFKNVTAFNGTGSEENGMGSAVGDYDNDGDLDWFVSSIFDGSGRPEANWGTTGNRLYRNQSQERSIIAAATAKNPAGPNAEMMKREGKDGNRMYRNQGSGRFTDVTTDSGVRDGNWGWGASFGDLDNDGDLDLYHVNGWPSTDSTVGPTEKFIGQPARLFENLGNGQFEDVAQSAGADFVGQGRGLIMFDYDNDGDLDLYQINNQIVIPDRIEVMRLPAPPALLRNDTALGNHWLQVTLAGVPPLHRNGIGSRVYLTQGGVTQMRELHASTNFMAQEPGRIAHFGLGAALTVEEVRAEWVNGDATILTNVSADQRISIPSPGATLSTRSIGTDEVLTATGARAEPTDAPRQWMIEGTSYPDPVTHIFRTPGSKELRLNLYETDGQTLLRAEILRLTVEDHPTGTGEWATYR